MRWRCSWSLPLEPTPLPKAFEDDGTISSAAIVAASPHPAIRHIGGLVESAEYLSERVVSGDVIIVFGAGDSYRIGELLLAQLTDREVSEEGQRQHNKE